MGIPNETIPGRLDVPSVDIHSWRWRWSRKFRSRLSERDACLEEKRHADARNLTNGDRKRGPQRTKEGFECHEVAQNRWMESNLNFIFVNDVI